jgi:hypothetical protein
MMTAPITVAAPMNSRRNSASVLRIQCTDLDCD